MTFRTVTSVFAVLFGVGSIVWMLRKTKDDGDSASSSTSSSTDTSESSNHCSSCQCSKGQCLLLQTADNAEQTYRNHSTSAVREATLLVCTKCSSANRPDQQPPVTSGPKPKTGLAMWQSLLDAFSASPKWRLYCNDDVTSVTFESTSIDQVPIVRLRLSQQQCFSACARANCVVACGQADRHTFHFGNLDPVPEDVEDLLQFVQQWTGPDGNEAALLAKAPARPARLGKANTISRLPPATSQ